jgi:ubiquitin-conjugating enzyme E2 C
MGHVDGELTRLPVFALSSQMASVPGISAFPASDQDLYEWVGTIAGPDATVSVLYPVSPLCLRADPILARLVRVQPYAGLTFRITLHFPANYPYTAPTIKFVTPCFHPNVALPGGDICLDILKGTFPGSF